MLNNEKYVDQHFKDHQIKAYGKLSNPLGPDIHILTWHKPDTWTSKVEYILQNGTLFVSGDLGSAVYRWQQDVDFPWLAGCDFGYFAGKCEASESGRPSKEWDGEAAKKFLESHRAELIEDKEDNPESLKAFEQNISTLLDNTYRQDEFQRAFMDIDEEERCLAFGSDPSEWGRVYDCGSTDSLRCHLHWAGIVQAMKKFATQKMMAV